MFRMRRYRVFLVFAFFVLASLYYFTSVQDWEGASAASIEGLKNVGLKDNTPIPDHAVEQAQAGSNKHALSITSTSAEPAVVISSTSVTQKVQELTSTTTSSSPVGKASSSAGVQANGKNADLPISLTGNENSVGTAAIPATPAIENTVAEHGQGRLEVIADTENRPKIHWSQLPEHFPIPSESIIQLPTGKPKPIPKIQHPFTKESPSSTIERERKLTAIKKEFEHSWAGYKKYAWLQDELSPITGKYRNPFCGWAATLVDSLDSLWILGMKDEFDEAANAIRNIDFTTSIRNDIPLFETTIRYLGGLVGAYDISGGTHRVLLDKAVELAEVLMGAFDTPNRMPMTFYYWKPTFASQPHRASARVVLAELGSLSMEFTRLAQITKEARYYDAIARITNEFEIWQNNTQMPGLWPKSVDASGCKKPDQVMTTQSQYAMLNGIGNTMPQGSEASYPDNMPDSFVSKSEGHVIPVTGETAFPPDLESQIQESADKMATTKLVPDPNAPNQLRPEIGKRQLEDSAPSTKGELHITPGEPRKPSSENSDCEPQGLASPPHTFGEDFTLGGMADSVYEYLPKQYMLLGGREEQYRSMYEAAVDTTKEHLLFRPMLPDGRNILLSGSVTVNSRHTGDSHMILKPEGTHLTCFAGGMFAVGAKIFGRTEDIDIAVKLTDGCIWAYEATQSGIMPEGYLAIPCDSRDSCPWNQTKWYQHLDPYRDSREKSRLSQQQKAILKDEKSFGAEGVVIETEAEHVNSLPAIKTSDPTGAEVSHPTNGPLSKRQVGEIENEAPGSSDPKPASEIVGTSTGDAVAGGENPASNTDKVANQEEHAKDIKAVTANVAKANRTNAPIYTPPPIPTHEEFVKGKLERERLPAGMTGIDSRKYILRPEAIESVFIMYRVTGDEYWRQKGWNMFTAIQNYTHTAFGSTAVRDVTSSVPDGLDEMESFWLAETLKYFYLLFSKPDVVSLDDYVLNTEAHAFKRPK